MGRTRGPYYKPFLEQINLPSFLLTSEWRQGLTFSGTLNAVDCSAVAFRRRVGGLGWGQGGCDGGDGDGGPFLAVKPTGSQKEQLNQLKSQKATNASLIWEL